MTSHATLSTNSLRQAGFSQRAESWSAPTGELGDGVCPATIVRGTESSKRPSLSGERSHRGQPAWPVDGKAIRRNDALDYPALRAEIRNGADSDRRCRTP